MLRWQEARLAGCSVLQSANVRSSWFSSLSLASERAGESQFEIARAAIEDRVSLVQIGVHGLNTTVFQYFQCRCEKKKEGLRPSCSTHVRESPRTWGTRPGSKAWWETGKAEDEMTATPRIVSLWIIGL